MTAATDLVPLSQSEVELLQDCEETISRGLKTFFEVGQALYTIRDSRLYRTRNATFEDYCRERWGFNRHRAAQLIAAVGVVTTVTTAGLPAPENEKQARELGRVPQAERPAVWQEAHERTGGKPTAAVVRKIREERLVAPVEDIVDAEIVDGDSDPWGAPESAAAPVEQKPRRRPITDSARDAGWDLNKAVERIERLLADDRYARNANQVAPLLRGHLMNAVKSLSEALDQLPTSQKETT